MFVLGQATAILSKTTIWLGSALVGTVNAAALIAAEVGIDSVPEVGAWIAGTTTPIGLGWFLWRQLLKAQDAENVYVIERNQRLEDENTKLLKLLAAERAETARLHAIAYPHPPKDTPS